MMRLLFFGASLVMTGCYVDLGIGITGALGPHVDNRSPGGYVVVGSGVQFDEGTRSRIAVGTSLHLAQIDYDKGFSPAFGYGLGAGYDHRVHQWGTETQLRVSGRATLWDITSDFDVPGTNVPATNVHMHDGFLGVTLGVGCNPASGCGQISVGMPLTFVYSNETRWALVTGGEIRFSVGQTLWDRVSKSSSADQSGALSGQ